MTPVPPRVRLVVLFGGRSAEHDVSRVTARHVLAAADPDRYEIVPVGITRTGRWVLAETAARALLDGPASLPTALDAEGPTIEPTPILASSPEVPTVVLPLLHGPLGEDGTVQGLLELADVPYVGSGVLGSAVAMDKAMAKQVLAAAGFVQARWRTFHEHEIDGTTPLRVVDALGLPVFVKPANMGSSVGVSKAKTVEELDAALSTALTYDDVVVVEEAVVGREIEVAVLGNDAPRASVPGEIVPGNEFYDYEDKYVTDGATLHVPAVLGPAVAEEARRLAIDAFRALRCAGMARVDFFYEDPGRGLLINEVNTIPGFTPISMYPKLWEASGVSYPELIDELVRLALERHHRRRRNTTR